MGKRPRKSPLAAYKQHAVVPEISEEENLNRRQKKLLNHNFKLEHIEPLTQNQDRAFRAFGDGQNILMYGVAGTGKTFLGLYFGLSELFAGNCRQVIIVRSAVASRDLGFMPGSLSEKMEVYEAPYKDICRELTGRADVYDTLKKKGNIDFMSTSFLRGLTFDDVVLVVDEAQNLSDHELNTVMTRVGQNCTVIICGDHRQDDLKMGKKGPATGIHNMIDIAEAMPSFDLIEFEIGDIVRSGFVREYIITRLNLKLD